jgi:acylphosphatase
MNTPNGTVKGKIEGDEGRTRQLMEWLQTTGSPKSNIEKAVFTEPIPIKKFSTRTFLIKR